MLENPAVHTRSAGCAVAISHDEDTVDTEVYCKHCVYILSVCIICPTLEDVKAMADKEYGPR